MTISGGCSSDGSGGVGGGGGGSSGRSDDDSGGGIGSAMTVVAVARLERAAISGYYWSITSRPTQSRTRQNSVKNP